jgi:hypothetical protein
MPSDRLIRRGERIVRTVASRLPPPRDDAFVTAAEAGFALLTGRRARGGLSTYKEPRINPVAFRLALSAYYDGDQHKAGGGSSARRRPSPAATAACAATSWRAAVT